MQVAYSHIPGVRTVVHALPYEEEVDGNTTYLRYTDGKHLVGIRGPGPVYEEEKVLILRKTVDGKITRWEKAADLWANRKTATYIPINSHFEKKGEIL